ncbi:MAG: DEAD/DEAH box helicase, partial [Candidatus Binatia bacterium]
MLSTATGLPKERCGQAIEQQLLASYGSEPNPETGFPVFAFRLHQFISRGDSVYASLEPESDRHITLQGQQFVPGDRARVLLPLVFCRECGQEYYCVRLIREDARRRFTPRELSDRLDEEGTEAGFLHASSTTPWPTDADAVRERLPDDWLEEHKGQLRVRRDRREDLPRAVRVATDGFEGDTGLDCHFVAAPFRFCLNCGVAYGFRQSSDFHKLATLATEGRSTATTVLNLAAILQLREDESLPKDARKILSFTDNRQDASLQAGHFNDFIEIGLLRAALYKAASEAGATGITHENLVHRVFDALSLPIELYAADPEVRFQALEETKRALRAVLGYRLYRDLERGWRITSPNLEQCGLLEIRYLSLDELCRADDVWSKHHAALAGASPETRSLVAKTLLDFMRRELCIKVDSLDPAAQESVQQLSSQRLIAPWALDENEKKERSAILFPRSRGEDDWRGNVYLSARGGFGQFLRRSGTFPDVDGRLGLDDTE